MLQMMEKRLSEVTERMNENLQGSARRTAQSLGDLQQRLQAIDKAQDNITKLSGDVLSLQDILSQQADARRVRRNPAARHRHQGAALGQLHAAGRRCRTASAPIA